MPDSQKIHQKEKDFHDSWADSMSMDDIRVEEAFESPLALENRFIMSILGNLKGRKVLDIGAGLGEASVYFAKQGAIVTATDISPGMMALAERLAAHHCVRINTLVGPAENLPAPENSFDVVHVANTIHHVTDKESLLRNARKYLRPGGTFISWDPLRYNPAINVYRRMATGVRTEDELPLGFGDLRLARRFFPDAKARCFWISGLTIFLKYYFIDRVHPNEDRYWKRIYRESDSNLRWWKPFGAFDRFLTRVPILRWLAWNVVIYGHR